MSSEELNLTPGEEASLAELIDAIMKNHNCSEQEALNVVKAYVDIEVDEEGEGE